MNVSLGSRIRSSVLYADVFGYPITVREVSEWIPFGKRVSERSIQKTITKLVRNRVLGYTPPFLYISGHKKIIQLRIDRLTASTAKWQKIRRIGKLLQVFPTIGMVGVSGGLAVNNADNEDDIDLLIVAKEGTVWITRFLVTILMEIVTKRRHPNDNEVKNSICLNMFLTDRSLQIPIKEQGWYTAHEVLQMTPIWERRHMYTKYLHANKWTRDWFTSKYDHQLQAHISSGRTVRYHIKWYQLLEQPLKRFQLWYMRKRRTTEVVSDTILRFHPNDARIWIRKSFIGKLKHHKVPLDKKYNQI